MKHLKSLYLVLLFTFTVMMLCPVVQHAQVLDVPECTQEYDQWCWAGSSWSVLQYYGNDFQQCEIAEYTRLNSEFHDFGSVNCCLSSSTPGWDCNYWNYNYDPDPGSIKMILIDMPVDIGNPSITNYGIARMLTESETADEIAGGRPFVIRICCGGHFVVGHGYQDGNLYYMDPWYGEGYGYGPFGEIVNGRTWTHTNVITLDPGPSCSTPQNLNATNITDTSATLSWDAVGMADSYDYRYKATSSGTWTTNTTSSTSVSVSGLSPGTEYEFQVRSLCPGSASSSYSSSFLFTTDSNLPPVADFTGTPTMISEGQSVAFTDTSTNIPTSWSWSFPGGNPSTSTSRDPAVVYNTAGVYNVTLTAANANGEDTETKTNYITVTEVLPTVGNTTVFSSNTTVANRRAVPYTMPENGTINSITMYHTGGSGSMILGIYDGELAPANRLGVTPTTAVDSSTGWQTVNLTGTVFVSGASKIWLAWVYESNPGIRFETGTPGRVDAGVGWSGGMPDPYGSGTEANYIYSIYATYAPGGGPTQYTLTTNTVGQGSITLDPSGGTYDAGTVVTVTANPSSGWQFDYWSGDLSGSTNPTNITMNADKSVTATFSETTTAQTVGSTDVFGSSTTTANRRAMPFTMPEDGTISSVTMYHTGGSGSMILGVYDGEGSPGNRLGVTATTPVSASTDWQTINLQSPAFVAGGTTVWLAWVYESNPGIRYETGSPGRVDAGVGWSGGMPDPYGSSSQSNYIYSIYATYTPGGGPTQYTLTTNTVGQGSVTLDPPGGTYNEDTVVTLTANPSSGWQFDDWSGDLSGSTNPTTITMNANKTVTANFSESGSAYCNSYGLDAGTYIDYVEFGSFSNASGSAGYTDFTNLTVNMTSGSSCSYRIEKGDSNGSGFRVWIDFNNDGDFDDSGEMVVSVGMYNNYCYGSFDVPSGLNVTTRMRVSVMRNNFPGPCDVFDYGEVEDYTVVIAPGGSTYCDSYGQNSATYIDYVEFGFFSNASGAAGYTDFTNKTVNMTSGGSCSYRIEKGDSNSSGFRVWIDFNNDGDFDDSGERVVSTGMWNNYCYGSFNVPSGLNVTTRMRVSVKRNNYPGPCEVFSYGEVEDYTVVIQ
jgi:PKD repeat protein